MRHKYVVERILDYFPKLEPNWVVRQLRYSSFVSLEKRYMYVPVAKAASTQVKSLLREIENGPPIKLLADGARETRPDMFIHSRSNVPLPSLVDLGAKTQREVLESPNFLRFTVVRNPYSRLVSAWRSKVFLCEPAGTEVWLELRGRLPSAYGRSRVSFEEFVEYVENKCDLSTCNPHWRLQTDRIFYPALNFSCIARIEQLGEGLHCFAEHLGVSDLPLRNESNVSLPLGSATYTQEIADRVYGLYRPDFTALGYDRNTWPAANKGTTDTKVSINGQKVLGEITKRNVVMVHLYEERRRMRAQLEVLSRLRLLWAINALLEIRLVSLKIADRVGKRLRLVLRSIMGWKWSALSWYKDRQVS